MPQYYFHVQDGHQWLDGDGIHLPDMAGARHEALRASTDLLKDWPKTAAAWDWMPWRMWVTDQPNGERTTLFALSFSAEENGLS